MRLYIGILLTRTLYLTAFTSYSTSKISGHDLSPLGGTVGHKSLPFWIHSMQHCISVQWTRTVYLVSFMRYSPSKC